VTADSVLVAGIGNIFLGDDAFGVEVTRRLLGRPQQPGVRVEDFGIRGFDLAHALLDDYAACVFIDAVPRGGAPGTLYVIEPELTQLDHPAEAATIETHGMDPVRVLSLALAMGARPKRVLVVGCEPTPLDPADLESGYMGLSEPVVQCIDAAVELVESVVADLVRKVAIAR
jgi:hydrogenase maturation protease